MSNATNKQSVTMQSFSTACCKIGKLGSGKFGQAMELAS